MISAIGTANLEGTLHKLCYSAVSPSPAGGHENSSIEDIG